MTGTEIALGVKVFNRSEKLARLLDSAENSLITHVYVADDGKPDESKRDIYDKSYNFDLTVIDLEYDAGLGYGRNEIVKQLEEDYLLIVDSDHELVSSIKPLHDILQEEQSLGGISGLLLEDGGVTGTCHDLYRRGSTLIRDVQERKKVKVVAGNPVVHFDFLPNVTLFRSECLREYSWDPEYIIGKEHLDFYEGQRQKTDWDFGVCPSVLFGHFPGGDSDYIENREAREKLTRSRSYFFEKWGYDRILLGQTEWYDPTSMRLRATDHIVTALLKRVLFASPNLIQDSVIHLRDRIRKVRNRPPL